MCLCVCVWWVFWGGKSWKWVVSIFKYLLFYRHSYRKTQKVKNPSHTQTTPTLWENNKNEASSYPGISHACVKKNSTILWPVTCKTGKEWWNVVDQGSRIDLKQIGPLFTQRMIFATSKSRFYPKKSQERRIFSKIQRGNCKLCQRVLPHTMQEDPLVEKAGVKNMYSKTGHSTMRKRMKKDSIIGLVTIAPSNLY